jgi:hypothetical protein
MSNEIVEGPYDELDAVVCREVGVNDPAGLIEALLKFFAGKGTLYISSYDFGYWADRLSRFRSGDRVKINTTLPDPAFLENGFAITDEFVNVFLSECLRNIDPRSMFNQFLIYEKGRPLVQCCCNFEDVYVNTNVPQSIIKALLEKNIVSFWK